NNGHACYRMFQHCLLVFECQVIVLYFTAASADPHLRVGPGFPGTKRDLGGDRIARSTFPHSETGVRPNVDGERLRTLGRAACSQWASSPEYRRWSCLLDNVTTGLPHRNADRQAAVVRNASPRRGQCAGNWRRCCRISTADRPVKAGLELVTRLLRPS